MSQFCFGFEKSEEKEKGCFAAKRLPLMPRLNEAFFNAIDVGVGKDEEPALALIFGRGNSKHWIVSGSGLSVHTNDRIGLF